MKKKQNPRGQQDKAYLSFAGTIKKYGLLKQGDKVIAGLSGGADSVTLLHLLSDFGKRHGISIKAVHINHNLRGAESLRDECFCRRFCNSAGIELTVFSIDIKKEAGERGLTIEETGRMLRYEAFYEVMRASGYNKIAVAHNKNDNAETLFMRFVRGTGLKGLGGIPVQRGEIIRPLLYTPREDIISYCGAKGISFCEDSTNKLNFYTRNKIRLDLIPVVEKEMNPSVIDTLSSMSRCFAEENDFFEEIAEKELTNSAICVNSSMIELSAKHLSNLHIAVVKRLLRLAFSKLSGSEKNLSIAHINAAASLLGKENGKRVSLPCGVMAEKHREKLVLRKDAPKTKQSPPFYVDISSRTDIYVGERNLWVIFNENDLNLEKDLKKIYTISLGYDKIKNKLILRTRLPGDRIYIEGVGSKKIKDFLSGLKIEKAMRDELFYIADGDSDIAAVLSKDRAIRVSGRYAPQKTGSDAALNSITISIKEGK